MREELRQIVDKLAQLSDQACIVLYTVLIYFLEHYKRSLISYPTFKHLHKLIAAAQYTRDPEDVIFELLHLVLSYLGL